MMTTVITEYPLIAPAAPPANHLRKPTLFKPSAIVTSVANQTSTFQACLCASTSSHPTMRAITINESTNSATVVALISSPPKIQRPSASKASTAIDTSLKVMRPIFLSSSAAQVVTSGLLLISGGYIL